MADSSARPALSLWGPLRTPAFRNLLIADVVSDVGTFMQIGWRPIGADKPRIWQSSTIKPKTAASTGTEVQLADSERELCGAASNR